MKSDLSNWMEEMDRMAARDANPSVEDCLFVVSVLVGDLAILLVVLRGICGC